MNYVGNYLIPGANSKDTGIAYSTGSPYNRSYFAGNYYNDKLPKDQWSLVKYRDSWSNENIRAYKRHQPFETGPITEEDASTAYQRVLDTGGASLPKRDAVDVRVVNSVRNRTGKIIKSQQEVGGWPTLESEPAPVDSDRDGMPDLWEAANGLNPKNPDDRNKLAADSYTMLEKYINSIK
jgi:pectate lyase